MTAAKDFESTLKRLEALVESMERENLPLEKALQHYEEGVKLSLECQKKLTEAEQIIERVQNAYQKDKKG